MRLSERAGEIPSTEVTPAGASANGAGGAAGEAVGNPFLAAPSWEDASAAAGAANAAVMVGEGGVADAVAAAAGLTSAARCVLRLKRLVSPFSGWDNGAALSSPPSECRCADHWIDHWRNMCSLTALL